MARSHWMGAAPGLCAILFFSTAVAQPVTFADLEGSTIEVKLVVARVLSVNGKAKSQHVVDEYRLNTRGNTELSIALKHIVSQQTRGQMQTKFWSLETLAVLGKPHKYRDGYAVWIFEKNSLIRLRTLADGGVHLAIMFSQKDGALLCNVDRQYAREGKVGKVTSSSTMSGKRVDILVARLVSAECRVRRMAKPG